MPTIINSSDIITISTDGTFVGDYGNALVNINPRSYFWYYDDCINDSSWDVRNTGAGTAGQATSLDSLHPGVMILQTGSTNAGKASTNFTARTGSNTHNFYFGQNFTYTAYVNIQTLATVSDDYIYFIGMGDGWVFSDPNNGVYFQYNRSTSANWIIVSNNGGSSTATTSSTAVTTGWHFMQIVATSSSVVFSVDGTSLGTITTNLPTNPFNLNMHLVEKTAGTTNLTFYQDYFSIIQQEASTR